MACSRIGLSCLCFAGTRCVNGAGRTLRLSRSASDDDGIRSLGAEQCLAPHADQTSLIVRCVPEFGRAMYMCPWIAASLLGLATKCTKLMVA